MLNRPFFLSLLLSSLAICLSQTSSNANPASSTSSQATPTDPIKQSITTPTTVQMKETSQTVPLDLVQTRDFSTYLPTDRFVLKQVSNSSESEDIRFYWKKPDGSLDRETFIAFVFYGKDAKLSDVRQVAEVNAQILEYHGWRRITQGSRISDAKQTYSSWLRDLIRLESRSLRSDPPNTATTAYLGEVEGQPFVVFSSYSLEYSDEFTSREDIVLKNLKVKKRD